jgi:hypothetical protein
LEAFVTVFLFLSSFWMGAKQEAGGRTRVWQVNMRVLSFLPFLRNDIKENWLTYCY